MAKLTKEDIIASLKEMTIVELNDLVKAVEEEFGVTAAAPVAVAAPMYIPSRLWTGTAKRLRNSKSNTARRQKNLPTNRPERDIYSPDGIRPSPT